MIPSVILSNDFVVYDARGNGDGGTSPTITGDHNRCVTDYTAVVLQPTKSYGFHGQNSITAAGVEMREEQSPTLTTTKKADVVYAIDRAAFNQGENALYEPRISDDGINSTLVAKGPGAVAYRLYLTLKWIVRRLTPRECERLQGFPDDWTVLPKISELSDTDYEFYKAVFLLDKKIRGKKVTKEPNKSQIIRWYNGLDNDRARYRMLGNSLAIPCALRVIGYIADYERSNYNGK